MIPAPATTIEIVGELSDGAVNALAKWIVSAVLADAGQSDELNDVSETTNP